MNVIIPMAGFGIRFENAGYNYPKPLIKIFGKPMIQWVIESLTIESEDIVWIVHRNELNDFNFQDLLRFKFPALNIKFICLKHPTRGAAETLFEASKFIDNDESVVSLDCDTFYGDDVIMKHKQSKFKNSIFYFNDTQHNPIYSYIEIDQDGKILQIREKQKISNNANSGAYCFESMKIFRQYYEMLMKKGGNQNELYISHVYEEMIKEMDVYSNRVDDFCCVGTPFQLQIFSSFNVETLKDNKLRICFDIDNTLVTYPEVKGDYSTVKPIYKNINLLKFLKSNGCYIILYSARNMKTCNGNVGKVLANVGEVTINTLRYLDIPYDELHFGKPVADCYIDDLAINPYTQNVEKEMGVYMPNIDARFFNSITYKNNYIIKNSTNKRTLEGEIYWYKNIPKNIKHLFPKYIHSDVDSLIIERINGITFSYLYANKCLTIDNMLTLLGEIEYVHSSIESRNKIDRNLLYRNYAEKVRNRYNEGDFSGLEGSTDIYEHLISDLDSYQEFDSATVGLVHGDLVFSNILLDKNGDLKFIDMRGLLGDTLSVHGDILYDYAKIHQSLRGYDFVLNSKKVDRKYVQMFLKRFDNFILEKFDVATLEQIRSISDSLLFSLVPLHSDSPEKCVLFYNLIKERIDAQR